MVNDIIYVKLWNMSQSVDAQNYVSMPLRKEDFIKAGNLIDRQTMPMRICGTIFNEFYKKVALHLLITSELIDNDELKNSIIEYARAVENADVQLIDEDIFQKMLKELQDINDSI